MDQRRRKTPTSTLDSLLTIDHDVHLWTNGDRVEDQHKMMRCGDVVLRLDEKMYVIDRRDSSDKITFIVSPNPCPNHVFPYIYVLCRGTVGYAQIDAFVPVEL